MPSPHDVARRIGAAESQEPLVAALIDLGVPVEAMRLAQERGRLEDAVFEAELELHRWSRDVPASDIVAAGGPSLEELREIVRAWGFPADGEAEPTFGRAEADALIALGGLAPIWPPEIYLQAARVYGRALAHIAETETHLFRFYVERAISEQAEDPVRALALTKEAFERLLPLAAPLLIGVHQRWVEHHLAQLAARTAEQLAPDEQIPGAVRVTLMMCDLKDFTAYADEHGDAAAGRAIERFAEVVVDEQGPTGHMVKSMGDGFFLVYPEPTPAVDAAHAMVTRMADWPDLAVHVGIHHGVAIHREGDYFGRAVNITARLLSLSDRNVVLGTAPVAEATESRYAWWQQGPKSVRGVREPVEVFALAGRRPDDGQV